MAEKSRKVISERLRKKWRAKKEPRPTPRYIRVERKPLTDHELEAIERGLHRGYLPDLPRRWMWRLLWEVKRLRNSKEASDAK